MYAKLFDQMYDGTLASSGCWQALVTFQQMIILADSTGIVDITPEGISRRTTIPLDIITTGIAALEQPDPSSRSPANDGRRIVRLNEHRTWGWQLVNYAYYRNLRTADDRREYQREYYQNRKQAQHPSTPLNIPQQISTASTHTDAESESEAKKERSRARRSSPGEMPTGLNLEAWNRFVEYRTQLRKPIKPASMLAAQRKLAGFGADQAAVVDQSIANGWQGLFELKSKPNAGKSREPIGWT